MIALDANVLIAWVDGRDALHERAQAALREHVANRLCASVITLAELLTRPMQQRAAAPVGEALAKLDVLPVELRAYDHVALAELRARSDLKLPDCCVLLAAREMDAVVLSFDERLLRAARDEGIAVAA